MNISFIGMGNMAQALVKGFLKSGKIKKEEIFAYAPNQQKLEKNSKEIGFIPCAAAEEAVNAADLVIAACKPYQMEKVFTPLRNSMKGKILVSVASGWTFERLKALMGEEVKIQYILPNTPTAICSGVTIVESANSIPDEERKIVMDLLNGTGQVVEMTAEIMAAASSVTGCGPAFAAMIIEGLADGAVKNGVPREKAYQLVCGMLMGSAKLQLETGQHPGQMKDSVCSPGGTTIKGVAALEEAGLRSALIKAVDASIN